MKRGIVACRAVAAAAALLLAVGCRLAGSAEPLLDLATFPQSEIVIQTRKERHRFSIWVATSWPQRAQGLMYVRDLPADRGMLFVEQRSGIQNMWMKNTYIPLDMLFIDSAGRIARIAAMTKPFSLQQIGSGTPVKAVLELKGGEAARRGIRVGDRAIHEAFRRKSGPEESSP